MSGIDFVDTIVVRRSVEKGTRIISEPMKQPEWSGKSFKKSETKRLELAGDLWIMSGKGTTKIKLSEMSKAKTPDPKGHYIVTGRGTGKMKL